MPRPYDSSLTRVVPVFDHLRGQEDPWLERLVALPEHGVSLPPSGAPGVVEGLHYGANEKPHAPPRELLRWLVANLPTPMEPAPARSATEEKRQRLQAGDAATLDEALRLLGAERLPERAWYVLEGPTFPDVVIETPELVVVIEGKRTEPGPTTHTTWMPSRHQMLRHLDCAWEARGGRRVVGFFIVEGEGRAAEVPALWARAARETASAAALAGSLPHRTAAEREAIAATFLGVTTWQRVCHEFGIDWDALPDRLS